MPRVANYESFAVDGQDSWFELGSPGDPDNLLEASIDARPQSGEGGYLHWMIKLVKGESIKYQVTLNGYVIGPDDSVDSAENHFEESLAGWHSVHEGVSTSFIKNGLNKVNFKLHKDSQGAIRIRDVYLLWRQNA